MLDFLREKVEVIEGDVTQPGLGSYAPRSASSLQKNLDLIINSSGLTDFNPDLRDALATNIDAAVNVSSLSRRPTMPGCCIFPPATWRESRTAGSARSCAPNYNPRGLADFDAEQEWRSLHDLVKQAEAQAESDEVTDDLRMQAQARNTRPRICTARRWKTRSARIASAG